MPRRDDRSPEAKAYRSLYANAAWRKRRAAQLAREPLCAFCLKEGRTTAATVADHVVRHNGDRTLFFEGALQSLCDAAPWRCHSSRKQSIEIHGYDGAVGLDGWPSDPLHPANKTAR